MALEAIIILITMFQIKGPLIKKMNHTIVKIN